MRTIIRSIAAAALALSVLGGLQLSQADSGPEIGVRADRDCC